MDPDRTQSKHTSSSSSSQTKRLSWRLVRKLQRHVTK